MTLITREITKAQDSLLNALSPLDGPTLIKHLNHCYRLLSMAIIRDNFIVDADLHSLESLCIILDLSQDVLDQEANQ